jgi:endonuclease YncB( thermonuclease family)
MVCCRIFIQREGGGCVRLPVLLCALVVCASAHAQQVGSLITGPAVVVDGDTFDIGRDCGSWGLARKACDRIRIWGIDAPERSARCTRAGKSWRLAAPSSAALVDCLKGTTVTCRVQKIERRWLKTRLVSECWRDDTKEDVAACHGARRLGCRLPRLLRGWTP